MAAGTFNFKDYPIVLGIDFGTTFSGVGFSFATNEEVIEIVKWPKQMNVYPKTPTILLYPNGSKEPTEWGMAAVKAMHRPATAKSSTIVSQFKLHLDESLEGTLTPLPEGLALTDVVADYLRMLHNHIMSELKKGFAKNYDKHHYRYCLTVPAMWSDHAKSIMRRSAIQAGLISPDDHHDRLMLISEPEAAALYCERKCEQYRLKHGDRFMICDCGGGTVDLIVFEIEESDPIPEPPTGMGRGPIVIAPARNRKLKEVTRGHGQSCGSVFLDKNMKELLRSKFKQHTQIIPESALLSMMEEFVDLIKPNFDGVDEQFLKLPAIPGVDDLTNPAIGLDDAVLCLTAQELKDMVFEPVILEILALIREQLRQSPRCDAIFLVGGFGTSNYLHQRVEEDFGHLVGTVAMPPRAELAVVRGAVYFGLDPKIVTARMPRRTYGLVVMMPFEEGVDPEAAKIVREDGVWCDNRFSVYVKKGQTVGINECIPKNFFAFYPNDIYSPLYAYDGPEDSIPRYTTDQAVKKVAEFTIPMPYLPNVKKGQRVDYRTKLYFGLTEIRAEAIIHGKTYMTTCVFDANDEWSRPVVKD